MAYYYNNYIVKKEKYEQPYSRSTHKQKDIYLIRNKGNTEQGIINISNIYFPKELVGKRVRIKIEEVLEEIPKSEKLKEKIEEKIMKKEAKQIVLRKMYIKKVS